MYKNTMHKTFETLSKFKKEKKDITFNVQKVKSCDNSRARIATEIAAANLPHLNEESLANAVEKAYGGSVHYMPNSMHRLHETDARLVGFYVTTTRPSMSIEQASADSSMKKINDTVYQDDDDNIWTVHTEGASSYLVSQVQDNISDLINGLNSRSIITASHGLELENDFRPGSVMMYYDPNRCEVAFGVSTDGNTVYNPEHETLQQVDATDVLIVDESKQFEIEQASSKEDLLSYMQRLYGHNAAYMARIKEIISKYVSVSPAMI